MEEMASTRELLSVCDLQGFRERVLMEEAGPIMAEMKLERKIPSRVGGNITDE